MPLRSRFLRLNAPWKVTGLLESRRTFGWETGSLCVQGSPWGREAWPALMRWLRATSLHSRWSRVILPAPFGATIGANGVGSHCETPSGYDYLGESSSFAIGCTVLLFEFQRELFEFQRETNSTFRPPGYAIFG